MQRSRAHSDTPLPERHTARTTRLKRFASVSVALLAAACGDGSGPGGEGGNGGDGPISRGVAPPKFQYEEGPPGRAVGVRAIVEVDGVELTTDPLEMALFTPPPPQDKSRPDAAAFFDSGVRAKRASLGSLEQEQASCPEQGSLVDSIGAIDGNVCFLSQSLAAGSLLASEGVSVVYLMGREGLVQFSERARSIYYPPDFGNLSYSVGMGCVPADQEDRLSFAYFDSLGDLSFTYGIFFYTVGVTHFTAPGRGIVKGLRYDTGISVSASLIDLPVSMSLETSSSALRPGFVYVRNYRAGGPCSEEGAGETSGEENAMEFGGDRLDEFAAMNGGESLEDALAGEMGRGAGPLLDSLSATGEGGPGENVPSASNGDLMDDYLSGGPGTELPEGRPNTSLDGISEDFRDRVQAAGDNTNQILAGAVQTVDLIDRSVPSITSQAALLQQAGSAIQAGTELSELVDPMLAAETSYIAPNIRRVSVASGEPIEVTLTAQEIADLIGRPVEDVIGATIIVNAGNEIVDATFPLEDDELTLVITSGRDNILVRFDVDLSTADGAFPEDVASWVVRPSMVLIEVEAGPASSAYVTGPNRLPSGGPASLTVHAVDDNGKLVRRPYTVRFVDAEGNELGAANGENGSALFQYIPEPSAPRVTSVMTTPLVVAGEDRQGVQVFGTGFSAEARVTLDGTELEANVSFEVEGPEEILVVIDALAEGSHTLRIENPEGLVTEHSFTWP